MKYDYLIAGSGLFGATAARLLKDAGYSVLVFERNNHIGGNCYTKFVEGIPVHVFGPHVFHSNHKHVWDFLNRFTKFNHYRHHVKANYDGRILSLPFNMLTYHQFWGCVTPAAAERKLAEMRVPNENPQNLEEWCLSQIGAELYFGLVYYFTKKQWMREPKELPVSIIKRLPFRMTYDDCYFDDRYQGIPEHGYTPMFERMLDGIDVELNCGELRDWRSKAKKLIYTGSLDEYFDYKFGKLKYRSADFQEIVREGNFQGIAQMNFTSCSEPFTRVIEHKHFYFLDCPKTVLTYEFPTEWEEGKPRCYPINDAENDNLYQRYFAELEPDVLIGGRLANFRYLDMADCVSMAIDLVAKEKSSQARTCLWNCVKKSPIT